MVKCSGCGTRHVFGRMVQASKDEDIPVMSKFVVGMKENTVA